MLASPQVAQACLTTPQITFGLKPLHAIRLALLLPQLDYRFEGAFASLRHGRQYSGSASAPESLLGCTLRRYRGLTKLEKGEKPPGSVAYDSKPRM
jgi:hypothetical protein